MDDSRYNELCNYASNLRKEKNYRGALQKYQEAWNYRMENKLDISEKEDAFYTAGVMNCFRKKENKANSHIGCKNAIKLLNGFISRHKDVDLKKYDWLKHELIWSYLGYYFSYSYTDVDKIVKAGETILSFVEKDKFNKVVEKMNEKISSGDMYEKNSEKFSKLMNLMYPEPPDPLDDYFFDDYYDPEEEYLSMRYGDVMGICDEMGLPCDEACLSGIESWLDRD